MLTEVCVTQAITMIPEDVVISDGGSMQFSSRLGISSYHSDQSTNRYISSVGIPLVSAQ